MPALTFTADNATNQLTIAGHAFATGDGPVTPYTATGTLPTGTPAITALTDYWVKVDDANHLKLSTSQANALAGTTIDILTNGSGTLQLQYGLPYRKPRTYAAGSQVKSVDFNAQSGDTQNRIGIFEVIVALWALLSGQTQTLWTAAVTLANGLVIGANNHVTLQGTGEYKHAGQTLSLTGLDFFVRTGTATIDVTGTINSTSSCTLLASLKLKVGDRISSITATFDSITGTVDVTDFHVDKITANGTATSLGTTTVSNIGTVATTTLSLTPTTLAINECFVVTVAINATGCAVRSVNVTYTHP